MGWLVYVESLLGLWRVQSTVQPLCHISTDSVTIPFLRRLAIALASTFLNVSWFSMRLHIEDSGEQCTVVFAVIVCLCVGKTGVGGSLHTVKKS
jgi:hypothetical protein